MAISKEYLNFAENLIAMENNTIEFDYLILKKDEPCDDCYATVEFTDEEIEEIAASLMEQNSEGELTDVPEKYLNRFVDAALDDAAIIYPNFSDDKAKFSIMLQRFLPDDLLDFLPDEVIENFAPEMFEEVDEEEDCNE